MKREPDGGSRELALLAAKLAAEKKAKDIRLLEVGRLSIVADYFLIGTGNSSIQVHSICDHLVLNLKKSGCQAHRIEGYREGWWVVLDYGFLVIHIFQPDAREFYDLDRLWSDAHTVYLDLGKDIPPLLL